MRFTGIPESLEKDFQDHISPLLYFRVGVTLALKKGTKSIIMEAEVLYLSHDVQHGQWESKIPYTTLPPILFLNIKQLSFLHFL